MLNYSRGGCATLTRLAVSRPGVNANGIRDVVVVVSLLPDYILRK